MKKTFLYLGIGVLAFLFSLGMVFVFGLIPFYDLETSKNICQKCLDVSKAETLETKTLSEIIDDENFYGKKVRLVTRFGHDAGYTWINDSELKGRSVGHVRFDKDAISCADTEKTLRVCTGYENWYDGGSVKVTLIGYLKKNDYPDGKLQDEDKEFKIICIEQVNATDKELKEGKAKFESFLDNFIDLFIIK